MGLRISFPVKSFVATLLAAMVADGAVAVSEKKAPRSIAARARGKTRTAQRRMASVSESNRYSALRTSAGSNPSSRKDWALQLGIVGGYAMTSTNITSDQLDRNAARFDNNLYLGLITDARFMTYMGFELDGYLNLAPSRLSSVRNSINGSTTKQNKSLQQYGGGLAIKAQLPTSVGRVGLVPKAGIGYGLVGLKQTNFGKFNELVEIRSQAPYGMIGLEVEPISGFTLSTDYALSFAGTGDYGRSLGAAPSAVTQLTESSFDRFRAGAFVRISDPFMVGGQFVTRRLSYQPLGETQTFKERMNQFLGLLMVGF